MPKRRDVERHLARHGAQLAREGSRHSIWIVEGTERSAPVPRHRELSRGTVRAICKQLGVPPFRG